jgi:hypothetical protein
MYKLAIQIGKNGLTMAKYVFCISFWSQYAPGAKTTF